MSFRFKLILSYVSIIFVSFGSVAFLIDHDLEEASLKEIKAGLINEAELVSGQLGSERLDPENAVNLKAAIDEMAHAAKCRISVIDARGVVIADSEKSPESAPGMENHMSRPEIRAALKGDIGANSHYSNTLRIKMLYVAVPIMEGALVKGALRLALPLESVDRILFAIRRVVFSGLVFAIALSLAMGLLVATRISEPIKNMINVSRRYSEGDFSRRVVHLSGDELGKLAGTLNEMAGNIEEKIAEIKTRNQSLSAMFNGMVEGVVVVDHSGRILSVNHAVETAFGLDRKKMEGALFLDAIRNNEMWEIVTDVIGSGKAVTREANIAYPVKKIFRVSATPLSDKGDSQGCMIVMHDMTEFRRLETVRKDFIANISHELKTPLTSIKGFVETLLDGALEDRENNRQFLNIIMEHADRLNGLINDLLSLSRLESDRVTPDKVKLDLKETVDRILSGFMPQIDRKSVKVENSINAGVNVLADPAMLDQLLGNLIDNAIKFNRTGGFMKIYVLPAQGFIKVAIEDSGIGIPEAELHRVFERFYRIDKARSRDAGGTGLGLSIVKHIAVLHGGSVGVESVEGRGSTFWFSLPGFNTDFKKA